ncbi:cutinase family protein [Corynebacterium suicordis]|uniref:Cutinase family protein n=1 Tax=Corynebacterium suicordis DSM 45110 TaxID=1121369 RepID=A0ABR9ZLV6_9CORY|nr:cutinase family protein [Corynebacterium suicordis]MBF4554374.1 cutinase family protein [Corynebacterium suicordis DSM 45110]MDR6278602.1 hypothetical protein [Corynebacterium suicordis]
MLRRTANWVVSTTTAVLLTVAGVAPVATAQSEETLTSTETSSPAEETEASATSAASESSEEVSPKDSDGKCVDLFALGVQGTGQSGLTTPRDIDGGFLGEVLGQVFASASSSEDVKSRFAREYIPYDSGWGGFAELGTMSYRDSVAGGIKELERRSHEILAECPSTKLVPIGYSQGADVTDHFFENVGNGSSSIPAESIAAGFNMGAPARREAQPIVEGGRVSVDFPADTPSIDALEEITAPVPDGAGLTATGDHVTSYGDLDGRVVSFCEHGDLVCDMPADAPAARALAKLATSVTMKGNPFRALDQLSDALIMSPLEATSTAVNEDVQGQTLDSVSFTPSKSISQRLEDAAARDPEEFSGSSTSSAATSSEEPAEIAEESEQPGLAASAPDKWSASARSQRSSETTAAAVTGSGLAKPQESLASAGQALGKLGLIGVNALVAVARKTFTPDTIAQVASVGLVNPAAALPVLGAKVAASATEVLAPVGVKGASAAFEVAQAEVDSNQGLIQMATDVNYWSHWQKHSSYNHIPVDASGDSAMEYIRKFLVAATEDAGREAQSAESASTTSSETATSSSATETTRETSTSTQVATTTSSRPSRASETTTAG